MKTLRLAASLVGALLLGGGYFASQAAYFNRSAPAYTQAVEKSAIPVLALLLLGAAVVLVLVPDNEAGA